MRLQDAGLNNTAPVRPGMDAGRANRAWTILSGTKLSSRRLTRRAKGRMPEVSPIIRVTEIAELFRAD